MTTNASGDTPPWQPSAAWLEELRRRREEAAAGEQEAEPAPPPTIGELEQRNHSLRCELSSTKALAELRYRSCIRLRNENHVLLLRAGMAEAELLFRRHPWRWRWHRLMLTLRLWRWYGRMNRPPRDG